MDPAKQLGQFHFLGDIQGTHVSPIHCFFDGTIDVGIAVTQKAGPNPATHHVCIPVAVKVPDETPLGPLIISRPLVWKEKFRAFTE
jgi:hypothetical protein